MFNKQIRRSLFARVAVVLLLGIGIGIFWYTGLYSCITLAHFKCHMQWLQEQVRTHYWYAVLVYSVVYIGLVVCSLPGSACMNMVGGFLFGVFPTLIYGVVAATTGATLFFLAIRYVIGSFIQKRYQAQLHHFNERFKQQGWMYLLLARCIPFLPFCVTNMCAGFTPVTVWTFFWTTAVGIIPTTLIFAYGGLQLGTISQIRDIFSVPILSAFVGLLLLVMAPVLWNRWKSIKLFTASR